MKTLNDWIRRKSWFASIGATALTFGVCAIWVDVAKSDDPPALSIKAVASNQFQLTVTNGVATNNYEIYRRVFLDPLYPWTLHAIGTNGQTNFTTSMGIESLGFFEARSGNDSDADGVPNWLDADPFNAAIGVLSITIDSPTNGSTLY
jgi:hypothetical protein